MKRHPPAVSTEEGEKKMRNADCGTRNGGDGKQKSKVENRSAPVPSIAKREVHSAIRNPQPEFPYEAVIFDLLSALLNSWKLWNEIAGSEETGLRWRKRYIQLTYAAGSYRPYEGIIGEAAAAEGVPEDRPARLIQSWAKLEPWAETAEVLDRLQHHAALAVVTNCSETLAGIAVERTGITEVVTAERAGFYKPHPRAYSLALEELNIEPARALFVAGSSADLPGATNVGMPVFWHNRLGLSSLDSSVHPKFISDSLWPLIELAVGGNAKRGLRIAESAGRKCGSRIAKCGV
jgi:2-haloacid dehalogenase